MSQFLILAQTDYENLLHTFLVAVNFFNAQQFADNQLGSLLDQNVVLRKVKDQGTDPDGSQPVTGKPTVLQYLSTKVANDKPNFAPIAPIHVNGINGLVTGSALWTDHDQGNTTVGPITYSMTFVKVGGNWLLRRMYASPDNVTRAATKV